MRSPLKAAMSSGAHRENQTRLAPVPDPSPTRDGRRKAHYRSESDAARRRCVRRCQVSTKASNKMARADWSRKRAALVSGAAPAAIGLIPFCGMDILKKKCH